MGYQDRDYTGEQLRRRGRRLGLLHFAGGQGLIAANVAVFVLQIFAVAHRSDCSSWKS
jgi:hypothetical protein